MTLNAAEPTPTGALARGGFGSLARPALVRSTEPQGRRPDDI